MKKYNYLLYGFLIGGFCSLAVSELKVNLIKSLITIGIVFISYMILITKAFIEDKKSKEATLDD